MNYCFKVRWIVCKMRSLYLFFLINFIPFKVIPSQWNTHMPPILPSSNHAKQSLTSIAISDFFDSAYFSLIDSKRVPRSGLLSFRSSHTEPNWANRGVAERYASINNTSLKKKTRKKVSKGIQAEAYIPLQL